jgi:hypothetical protein
MEGVSGDAFEHTVSMVVVNFRRDLCLPCELYRSFIAFASRIMACFEWPYRRLTFSQHGILYGVNHRDLATHTPAIAPVSLDKLTSSVLILAGPSHAKSLETLTTRTLVFDPASAAVESRSGVRRDVRVCGAR